MKLPIDPEVAERLAMLDVKFDGYGLDRFGVSRPHLAQFFTLLAWLYRHYFRVSTHGIENVPDEGRVMLVGNHAGAVPVDGGMVVASMLLDHDPPRLTHGMVEKFAKRTPFLSTWFSRVGQLTGLPDHACQLLEQDRVLMVFPEGARGTGKLYKDRYNLVRFGTGFLRLAMKTSTPVVPFAFIGGEEAFKTMMHVDVLAKMAGIPYWPVPPQIVPIPMPVRCAIHYGEPMIFEGDGTEPDEEIHAHVDAVKARIDALIARGRALRRDNLDARGRET